MKTWQKWGLGLTITILLLMSTNKSFGAIKKNQKQRDCDPQGCGYFGAKRGTRAHNGIDIIFTPGEDVLSPISGTISRHPFPYASDLSYTGVEIKNSKYRVMLFYVANQLPIGTKVSVGQKIATAQNIAKKYGGGMTNHVHIEVYDLKGNLLNPETLYGYEKIT